MNPAALVVVLLALGGCMAFPEGRSFPPLLAEQCRPGSDFYAGADLCALKSKPWGRVL